MKITIDFIETENSLLDCGINTKYINCTKHAVLDYLDYKNISDKLNYVIESVKFDIDGICDSKQILSLNGLSVEKVFIQNYAQLFELCKKELESGNPLLLWCDWFYVQNLRFYKKIHNDPHNALIIGIDDINQKICISDRWLESTIGSFINMAQWVSIEELDESINVLNGSAFLQIFKLKEQDIILDNTELKNYIIYNSLDNMIGEGKGINNILKFSNDIRLFKGDKVKLYSKNIGSQLLKEYVSSRYIFSIYINNILGDRVLSQLFIEQAIAWWKIVVVLWGAQPDLYETSCIMKSFYRTEEYLFNKLREVVDKIS